MAAGELAGLHTCIHPAADRRGTVHRVKQKIKGPTTMRKESCSVRNLKNVLGIEIRFQRTHGDVRRYCGTPPGGETCAQLRSWEPQPHF